MCVKGSLSAVTYLYTRLKFAYSRDVHVLHTSAKPVMTDQTPPIVLFHIAGSTSAVTMGSSVCMHHRKQHLEARAQT